MTSRRSFITGLVAFVAAPAIVRAGSLMPVKNIDVYDTRCLWDYDIGCDVMILRVDRQLETMIRPTRYAQVIPVDIAKRIFGNRAVVFTDCPPAGKRISSFIEIGANRLSEFGFNVGIQFPNSGDNALGLVPAST